MRRLFVPLVLVLALACACACGDQRRTAPEPWITYEDTAHAFRVSFPASWLRAGRPLTPALSDPHEILTLSTRRARAGGERCGHVPEHAMRDLRAGDVLLTLQERRGSGGFGDRVRPFRLDPPQHAPANECAGRTDIAVSQGGFRDAGRGLHLLAAFGPGAARTHRAEVERVVDSLVLEPAWRSRRLRLRLQPPTGWRVRTGGRQVSIASMDVPAPTGAACALPAGARELPPGEALAFLFEYRGLNRTQRMRFPAMPKFSLRARDRLAYECFGESWKFTWRDRGRTFQAHAYLGDRAGRARRAELLAALRSIVALR